jgi:hypothetical protein
MSWEAVAGAVALLVLVMFVVVAVWGFVAILRDWVGH